MQNDPLHLPEEEGRFVNHHEQYPLRKNFFGSEMTFPPLHVSSSFGELRDAKEFSDVTLACEDDELMEGHKVILAPVNKEQSTI